MLKSKFLFSWPIRDVYHHSSVLTLLFHFTYGTLLHRLCKHKRSGKCLAVEIVDIGLAKFGCINSGPFPRSMVTASKVVKHKTLYKNLQLFTAMIEDWNTKPRSTGARDRALHLHELSQDIEESVVYAGPFGAQYLAKVLIRAGIIYQPELACQAIIIPTSSVYKEIVRLAGLDTKEDKKKPKKGSPEWKKGVRSPQELCIAKFLKAAASALQVHPAVAENLLCEMHRKSKKWDFTFVGQPVISVDESSSPHTLMQYFPNGKEVVVPALISLLPQLFPANSDVTPNKIQRGDVWWIPGFVGSADRHMVFTNYSKAESRNKTKRPLPPPRFLQLTPLSRPKFADVLALADPAQPMLNLFETEYHSAPQVMRKNAHLHPYILLAETAEQSYGNIADLWKHRLSEASSLVSPEDTDPKQNDGTEESYFGSSSAYPSNLEVRCRCQTRMMHRKRKAFPHVSHQQNHFFTCRLLTETNLLL